MIQLLFTLLCAPLLRLLAGHAPARPQRVLVIQLAKIGDLLCASAVFREIKRHYRDAQLTAMVNAANAGLLRHNPHVDEIVVAEARDFRGLAGKLKLVGLLRSGRYDTLVCLNSGAAFATAALWARIPRRLAVLSNFPGASHRLAARLWSDVEPHRGDRLIQQTYMALLGRMGIANGDPTKEVFAAPDADAAAERVAAGRQPPLLGIAVSSANRLKALGAATITDVARRLLDENPALTLVLIGGPEDRGEAREILAALPAGRVIDSCGQLALAELPALLRRLTAFLGVDSGITYMADTLGVPLVSVAGPCNMQETRPLGRRVVILSRDLPCRPCAHIFRAPYSCRVGTRACIVDIPAEQIQAAVGSHLSEANIEQ